MFYAALLALAVSAVIGWRISTHARQVRGRAEQVSPAQVPFALGFGVWAMAGATAATTVVTLMSVGAVLLPIAFLLLFAAARWFPRLDMALGVIVGIGASLLVVPVVASHAEDALVLTVLGTSLVVAGIAASLRVGSRSRHRPRT